MKQVRTRLGDLDAVILDPGTSPEVNVVLCHGYGAPAEDLTALGPELAQLNPELGQRVRWVFPAAPLTLAELGYALGRAWWHLDMEQLAAGRDWDRYVEEVPEGLPKARRMLTAAVQALSASTGVPLSRTVLGGFSQGGMLATDLALRLEEAPQGLCILSGTLLSRAAWEERAKRRAGLPVFQSHGSRDPLLPFEVAERLRALLEDAGMKVTWAPFPQDHTIPMSVVHKLAEWLTPLTGSGS